MATPSVDADGLRHVTIDFRHDPGDLVTLAAERDRPPEKRATLVVIEQVVRYDGESARGSYSVRGAGSGSYDHVGQFGQTHEVRPVELDPLTPADDEVRLDPDGPASGDPDPLNGAAGGGAGAAGVAGGV